MSNVDLMREFWRTWSEEGPAALIERYDEFFTDDAEWSPPVRELAWASYDAEAAARAQHAIVHREPVTT